MCSLCASAGSSGSQPITRACVLLVTTARAGAKRISVLHMGNKRRTRRKHSAYNLPNEPGVYLITSPTGRYYIGRSKDIRKRCLAHQYRAYSDAEENQILNRSIRKYKMRMRYQVLLQTHNEQDAVYFEEQYIRMHWRDGMCMNAKTGDKITGDYNKDHKSKSVRYVHCLTGGSIVFKSRVEAARFFGLQSGTAPRSRGLLLQETCSMQSVDDWNRRVIDEAYAEGCQRRVSHKNMLLARHEDGSVMRFDGVKHLMQTHGGAAVSAFYQQRPSKGWLYRRAFEPWPTPRKSQVQKIGVMIKATHVDTGQITVYTSIGDARRKLGVSHTSVLKALRKERKTAAQHYIDPYP